MRQEKLFHQTVSRRDRTLRMCSTCKSTTDHLKEAGASEYKCVPCEARRKQQAALQKAGGI